MPEISHTAYDMISQMKPELRSGSFVFVTLDDPALIAALSEKAISTFREDEGISMIVPLTSAEKNGFGIDQPMRCITLNVYSALDGVGLTSAVSAALGDHGIACNMVAAFHHDHVFVPSGLCEQAMQILLSMQNAAVKGP